jgi:hypothetical protein
VKGRDGSFFFFDFSTRKLPLECEVFTGRALGDEHAILIFDYDPTDRDRRGGFHDEKVERDLRGENKS